MIAGRKGPEQLLRHSHLPAHARSCPQLVACGSLPRALLHALQWEDPTELLTVRKTKNRLQLLYEAGEHPAGSPVLCTRTTLQHV